VWEYSPRVPYPRWVQCDVFTLLYSRSVAVKAYPSTSQRPSHRGEGGLLLAGGLLASPKRASIHTKYNLPVPPQAFHFPLCHKISSHGRSPGSWPEPTSSLRSKTQALSDSNWALCSSRCIEAFNCMPSPHARATRLTQQSKTQERTDFSDSTRCNPTQPDATTPPPFLHPRTPQSRPHPSQAVPTV
jgi:hypothetical protein